MDISRSNNSSRVNKSEGFPSLGTFCENVRAVQWHPSQTCLLDNSNGQQGWTTCEPTVAHTHGQVPHNAKIFVQIPWLYGGKWSKYNGLMEFRVSLKIEVSTWNSTCMNFQHGTQCIFQKSFQTQDRTGQESTSSETDWNGVCVPYWAQWGKMVVKMRHLEDRITFLKVKVFAWGFDIIFSTSMLRNNSIFRISF